MIGAARNEKLPAQVMWEYIKTPDSLSTNICPLILSGCFFGFYLCISVVYTIIAFVVIFTTDVNLIWILAPLAALCPATICAFVPLMTITLKVIYALFKKFDEKNEVEVI